METIYGSSLEGIDPNAPPPEGKPVSLSFFADANLMHDAVTGDPPVAFWNLSTRHLLIGSVNK